MSANVANRLRGKLELLIFVLFLLAGLCGYYFMWYLDWEETNNLKKVQTFRLNNGETLKDMVERMFPGGVWTGGELVTSYKNGTQVFFWDKEGDRVLAASIATIEMFSELSPHVEQSVLNKLDRNMPFDPFQFERDHPLLNRK